MARAKKADVKSCRLCQHPERMRVEMLRLAGTSGDVLADRFGLSRDTVYRHCKNHVPDEMKAQLIADVPLRELADRAAEEGLSLISYLSLIRQTVVRQLLAAAAINDSSGVAALTGKATDVLREIGKLTGEMMNVSGVTNITNNTAIFASPSFARLESMLLEALQPHPEAMQAVLAGLERLEAAEASPAALTVLSGSLEVPHARAA